VSKETKKLLIISGKANRKNFTNPTNIPFRKDVYQDMEKYCSGSQIGIVNSLLRKSLDSLIADKKLIIEELD
jgi:hypothetical protein